VPVVARMAGGCFPVPAMCLMARARLGSVAVSVVGGLVHDAVSSKVDNRSVIPRTVKHDSPFGRRKLGTAVGVASLSRQAILGVCRSAFIVHHLPTVLRSEG